MLIDKLNSWLWVAPLCAFVLSLLFTPRVIKLSYWLGAVDRPDPRKVHRRPVPRLGGLAIWLSFGVSCLIFLPLDNQLVGLLMGGALVFLFGLWDDLKGITPRIKLLGQVSGSLLACWGGVKIGFLSNPFQGVPLDLGFWGLPLTVFWLVAVSNAVNLIDGLDGLAGGVGVIAALTMVVVAFSQGSWPEMVSILILPALILVGSLLGFLRYNFHPARIFMGDCGSLTLGFILGGLAVTSLTKSALALAVFIPILILGVPLLDTAFAIFRRIIKHRPIFQPDREHLHHQLLAMGLSHRQAVLVIYALSAALGASAWLLNRISTDEAIILLAAVATVTLYAANRVGVLGNRYTDPNSVEVKLKGK